MRTKRSNFSFDNSKLITLNSKLGARVLAWFCLIALILPTGAVAMPRVERTVLANKLVLLVAEEHSLPFVTLQLLVDSGSRKDPAGKEGIARLAARGLLLGTPGRSATAINRDLDFMGASLTTGADLDYTTLNLRVLKKELDRGLDLFMDVLTRPVFPEAEIQKEVQKTLAAIHAEEDQPNEVAEKAFQKELFLSPYGHPVEGTKESLPGISRGEIEFFYGANYLPNNAVLVVVGDITAEDIRTRLIPRLEAWQAANVQVVPFAPSFAGGPKTVTINRSITQANIIIGHAGVSRGNPDYYAITVMNYILGSGGFSSRLFDEIRVRRGLAYSVTSFFDPHRYPGSFQIALQTKNASARDAIRIAREEMEKMRSRPVKTQEIEGAKRYLIGSFPMRVDTQAKLARFIAQVEYYGLGLDYPVQYPALVGSVTVEKVQDVAKQYLHPDRCLIVIVADLKEAGMETSGARPLTGVLPPPLDQSSGIR